MQINGTIKFIDLEGGFYGIEGDDGTNYRPKKELPGGYQKDGLRITANVSMVPGFSIFMWGRDVRVHDIARI